MKILHCADLHLRDKDLDECANVTDYMVEAAVNEDINLIVIAGDIFDQQDIKAGSASALLAVRTVSALADISPVVIVRGTPSHDGNAPGLLAHVRGDYPIIVADRPMQVFLLMGKYLCTDIVAGAIPDAILTLIPQPTKQFFQTSAGIAESDQEIGQAMSGLFAGFGATAAEYPGVPHILVYHGCVSGGQASNGQVMTGRDIEVSRDQMAITGAHLVLCGHLHLPQELPGNIFYSGSIYANNIGEDHKHGFYVHHIDNRTIPPIDVHEFIETPCKRTIRITRDYTTGTEPIIADGVEGAHVRVDLTVWQDEAEKINKDEIKRDLTENFGAMSVDVRINRVPRENVRADAVLKAETLREKIVAMAALRDEKVNDSILKKADALENMDPDALVRYVGQSRTQITPTPETLEHLRRQI